MNGKAPYLAVALWLLVSAIYSRANQVNGAPDYAAELRLGNECYARADYPQALAHYRQAVQLSPEACEARLAGLLPLLALNRFAEAEAEARSILRQHPGNYYANLRLAFALRMQYRFADAETVLDRLARQYPTDVALLLELALVKFARQQRLTARQLLDDVLTLAPDNSTALQQVSALLPLGELRDEPLNLANRVRPPGKFSAEAAAYYAYLDYHGTLFKDHAHSTGLYAALGYGPEHFLEMEGDFLHKFYRGFASLQQWDAAFAYANYSIPQLKLRAGLHWINSQDPFTDQGLAVFGGAEYYQADRWALGGEVYYSDYPKFQNHLNVFQLTPHAGLTLWRGATFTLRNDVRGYWIHLNQDTFGPRDHFSIEDRLTLDWRRWTFTGFGWGGEQLFAVRNDGFAMFNLGELHRAGYGAQVRYALNDHLSATVSVSREHFRDLAVTPHATSELYLAMLNWKF